MKKLIAVLLVVFLAFSLTACLEGSYSANGAKSGLEVAGYDVSVYTPEEFERVYSSGALKTSEMSGLQTVIYAEKRDAAGSIEERGLLLVFDSIGNCDKVTDEQIGLLYDFASKYSQGSPVVGKFNNVAASFSSSALKKAAGIN